MHTTDVVLLQSDPMVAEMLARSLSEASRCVRLAKSLEDLHFAAAKHQPAAIVLDLETATLEQIKLLKEEFRNIHIVCNHRVPDEAMWSATLGVGADDCCSSSDLRAILHALPPIEQPRAATA
jgi:DNA-binding NarL/FixJ family response regulator